MFARGLANVGPSPKELMFPRGVGWRMRVARAETSALQPRSGKRMEPTAQAVGTSGETSKPQRGERSDITDNTLS